MDLFTRPPPQHPIQSLFIPLALNSLKDDRYLPPMERRRLYANRPIEFAGNRKQSTARMFNIIDTKDKTRQDNATENIGSNKMNITLNSICQEHIKV